MDERWIAHGSQALAPEPLGLTFQQTVPRRLVHRAAVAEVFLTDAVVLGEDRFLVGAQWPRDHALYHPDARGGSDPLLFAETIRQAMVFLAHWHYGIPLTHRFVGRGMSFEITEPDALRVGGAPQAVELEARWRWNDRRPPRRYGFEVEMVLSVDGRVCGSGVIPVIAVDDRAYRMVRGRIGAPEVAAPPVGRGARRLAPELVGRLRAKDSVLAPAAAEGEWLLAVDPGHAILFDHATDHLPLMVLLEGFRQLGHLLVHDTAVPVPECADEHGLVALDVECLSFAELDLPTRLVARQKADGEVAGPGSTSGRRLDFAAFQGDTVVARCATTWKPVGAESTAHSALAAAASSTHGSFDGVDAVRR